MRILCQTYDFYDLKAVRSVEFAGIEFGHCSAHFLTLSFVGLIACFCSLATQGMHARFEAVF